MDKNLNILILFLLNVVNELNFTYILSILILYLKKKTWFSMTQEEKDLLLKDLCGRLPYGVKVDYESDIYILNEIDTACKDIDYITVRIQDVKRLRCAESILIENIKPYLRPMSSMTEEESAELSNIISEWFDKELFYLTEEPMIEYALSRINYSINPKLFDWLNKHHFDYRGLIKKGLAIETTKENNQYEEHKQII